MQISKLKGLYHTRELLDVAIVPFEIRAQLEPKSSWALLVRKRNGAEVFVHFETKKQGRERIRTYRTIDAAYKDAKKIGFHWAKIQEY